MTTAFFMSRTWGSAEVVFNSGRLTKKNYSFIFCDILWDNAPILNSENQFVAEERAIRATSLSLGKKTSFIHNEGLYLAPSSNKG